MANGSIVGTDAPEPPDLPVHAGIRAGAMDFPDEALRAMHGNRILGKIAAFLPAVRDAPLEWLSLGFRPMPTDEFPVVGALPATPDVLRHRYAQRRDAGADPGTLGDARKCWTRRASRRLRPTGRSDLPRPAER